MGNRILKAKGENEKMKLAMYIAIAVRDENVLGTTMPDGTQAPVVVWSGGSKDLQDLRNKTGMNLTFVVYRLRKTIKIHE